MARLLVIFKNGRNTKTNSRGPMVQSHESYIKMAPLSLVAGAGLHSGTGPVRLRHPHTNQTSPFHIVSGAAASSQRGGATTARTKRKRPFEISVRGFIEVSDRANSRDFGGE